MSHLDLNGLQRYAQKEKEWADARFASAFDMNWQRTATAGAVTCYPLPAAPIDPTVNFLFTETGPSSGDKSPSNPSTINGVSNVNIGRTGRNLYNVFSPTIQNSFLPNPDDNGWITASGDKTTYGTRYPGHYNTASFAIKSDKTYTLVVEIESISNCSIQYSINSNYAQRSQLNTGNKNLNSAGTHFIVCSNNNLYDPNCVVRTLVSVPESGQFSIKFRSSVYEGIVDASNFKYEPYAGTDYTVNLGGTYYGGSVDLATGLMTVTHACVRNTPNASASAGIYGDFAWCFLKPDIPIKADNSSLRCTRFITSDTGGIERVYCRTDGFTSINCIIQKSRLDFSSAANPSSPTDAEVKSAFDAWLEENPVDVAFKLYTPYTVQLTPTQIYSLSQLDPYIPRINTVYSDQVSVQVGYPKSPQATSTELTNAIISLGSNL